MKAVVQFHFKHSHSIPMDYSGSFDIHIDIANGMQTGDRVDYEFAGKFLWGFVTEKRFDLKEQTLTIYVYS